MKYKVLWTDMHSNLHHERIEDLPKWLNQIRQTMDFWPFAYYPYYMRKDESGLGVEDRYPLEAIEKDWEYIRSVTQKANDEGFPMFMGYEWQGAGKDGDHNVFLKDNQQKMEYPLRYEELVQAYEGKDAIGIPHHLAYQLEHRGKNWQTHNDQFSPFVEIYSSHGSSENDTTCIEMNRHVHMGPRTGMTCVERGWEMGHKYGVIAAGDNHSCPGVYGFGYTAVLAEDATKEAIWDAFVNRRVYGVSKDRIELDYTVDSSVMGSEIEAKTDSKLDLKIKAANAIDRIEIIKDNRVIEMIPHTSTWENQELTGTVRFKFQLELGWGPDRRIFPDIESRNWTGSLKTPGKLLSIEKCWSTFGQNLTNVTEQSCDFEMTTYKTTATGKWMGPSAITTEGFIFEIEDDIDSHVVLTIDGKEYVISVRDLMYSSRLFPLLDEVSDLLKERFNFTEFYRSDSWWHNCYKIKVHQAVPEAAYTRHIERIIDTTDCHSLRVRVWQKNGGVAWSSPIFVKKEQ
ncbi:MAG: hypothetical protein IJ356_00955 [Erysipelotrichaceae bacterium]|nr:hypothetical protein [Erysipelotrichaceae bacterium]